MKNETICWECLNCTKCSWSRGIPVERWKATPSTYKDDNTTVNSYIVHKCPLYKPFPQRRIFISEICKILKISLITFYRCDKNKIREMLREKGYKLYVYLNGDRGGESNVYYVEKIKKRKKK